jgi:hypothetical protein
MKSFKQYITEVVSFKNNSSWALSPSHGFEIKPSGAKEHPDLFRHLDFMGRESKVSSFSRGPKERATAWGRVDPDNKVVHIITQNGGLSPNRLSRGLENDVFARLGAIEHLRERYPEYRVHVSGGWDFVGKPTIVTHGYSEHEKYLTGMLRQP